jgi:GT2 family glycosyltransferase
MTLQIMITCHNRREITLNCLRRLAMQTACGAELRYVVVDDGSLDGTAEAITKEFPAVRILKGDGSLYWCGGMRMAWAEAAKDDPDYYLLLNDDTELFPEAFKELLQIAPSRDSMVIAVAAICDPITGKQNYGGHRRNGPVATSGKPEICETFNANCVLVPRAVYRKQGMLYCGFTHGMGDFDYGFQATKKGIAVIQTGAPVGTCKTNPKEGTWGDRSLPRLRRLQLLESPKGLPFKEWFVFIVRNNGWRSPYYIFSPIIRILLGR